MRIDHIGYAVKRIDRAIKSFQSLGFTFEPTINDMDRNVCIAFGEKEGYRIELVCPLDKTLESPVDTYLGSVGPTPYHICYATDDLDAEVAKLQSQGFRVVIEPCPAVAFNGRRVVFMASLGIGLVEIVETSKQ